MAQKSGFFTSSSGDRKYGSDWLAQYIAAIISNGVYTTELTVSGDNGNMSVTVGTGRAWINGYMYSNDSNMTMALSAADGALGRTDLVVLRLDMTNRQITLAVVQGDFGGGVPSLTRTSDIYELCLAQISVAAGTTQITAQMITDTRADETVCGIVAGAVTQLSTGELLEQLKAGFEEWFDGIKGQLSEDAAGNLQNQINNMNDGDVDGSLQKQIDNANATINTLKDSGTHVFLREIVTGSDALQVDIDISDIDWSKYRHILMLVDARCDMGSVVIRLNGLAASGDYRYLNSDLAQINSTAWGSFSPNTPTVTYRVCLKLTGGITYPECNTTVAGTALSRTYFCINALANPAVTVNLSNSTVPIKAGSTITIYGVKV